MTSPESETSDVRGSVVATQVWSSYAEAPSGARLAALIVAMPVGDRRAVLDAVEHLFFERGDWRVAQHAALLHLDRFEPHTGESDLVKALCFADYACLGSKDDPRARLVMGRVNWERRVPLAVLFDVETARGGEARLRDEMGQGIVEKMLGETFVLEGLACAYLREVTRAHGSLIQAEGRGVLTIEAVIQLLLVAEPDFPEASMWAAAQLPVGVVLGGRAGVLQQHADRRRLISLLRARGEDVRG